jgi:tryptophan 2,3-dioxygenase
MNASTFEAPFYKMESSNPVTSDTETAMSCPYQPPAADTPAWHDAQMKFDKSMSYGDYLSLDELLSAQHPISTHHDEMLFIVQHQTSELWMKLALHELTAARDYIRADRVEPALKVLARVSRIMEQLVQAWTVLSTLTPSEYSEFRDVLGASSGFQSYQYRQIEFILGNKNPAMTQPHEHHAERNALVVDALNAPSLYDEIIALMARRGLPIDAGRLERDWTQPTTSDVSVELAWLTVYRDTHGWWDVYALGEKLIDLEDAFRQWRFRHVTTVERVIGFKRGTGGTAGVSYLRKMLDVVLFPELWHVRTAL